MFSPPANLTLSITTPVPNPFYGATKILDGDWQSVAGPSAIYLSGINKTLVGWQMVGQNSGGYTRPSVAFPRR